MMSLRNYGETRQSSRTATSFLSRIMKIVLDEMAARLM
jgi:hypothetical protein